jgi:DNA/RNA endonuclease G (NUC1)
MQKIINKMCSHNIYLIVFDKSREAAWITLTNIGAKVDRCQKNVDGDFVVDGTIEGANLIQIEQLERNGWEWG